MSVAHPHHRDGPSLPPSLFLSPPPFWPGTVWREEWNRDFQYKYATDPLAAEVFPEGHVHEGCFDVFKMLHKELADEVRRVRPKHIMIGGHSLGGTQAIMHGFHLQQLLGLDEARVDVVTIGAPMLGDKRFIAATGRVLNQRNLVYVGDGAGGSYDQYRVGDPIVQYTCGPYMGCEALGTGPTGARWSYARNLVQVPFTARDLSPNTERWYEAENEMAIPSGRSIAATHFCSYMCFLSKGTEDELSLCYFRDQTEALGLTKGTRLCYFPEIPL